MKAMVKYKDKYYALEDTATVDGTDWYFYKDDDGYSMVRSSKTAELVNVGTLSDTSPHMYSGDSVVFGTYNNYASQDTEYKPVEKVISPSELKYFEKLQNRVMRFWQRLGFIKRSDNYNKRHVQQNWLYPIPTVYACLAEVYKNVEWLEIRGIMVDTEQPNKIDVTVHLCRPGLLIGKRGSDLDRLQKEMQKWFNLPVKVNVEEVKRNRTFEY